MDLVRVKYLLLLLCCVLVSAACKRPEQKVSAPGADSHDFGIEWVSIPGGTIRMGLGLPESYVPHDVTVRTFDIAKTLVTKAQYKACVDVGECVAPTCGWPPKASDGNYPITCVSWEESKKFCEWVGGRLPSEAEWEYAARGGSDDREFPWGDDEPTCYRANTASCDDIVGVTPVCSKPAGNTKHGLCDMAGNVWEWTQDWYHDSYKGAPTDGRAWEIPPGVNRVIRGGSWNFTGSYAKVWRHEQMEPGTHAHAIGFRPVRKRW